MEKAFKKSCGDLENSQPPECELNQEIPTDVSSYTKYRILLCRLQYGYRNFNFLMFQTGSHSHCL